MIINYSYNKMGNTVTLGRYQFIKKDIIMSPSNPVHPVTHRLLQLVCEGQIIVYYSIKIDNYLFLVKVKEVVFVYERNKVV